MQISSNSYVYVLHTDASVYILAMFLRIASFILWMFLKSHKFDSFNCRHYECKNSSKETTAVNCQLAKEHYRMRDPRTILQALPVFKQITVFIDSLGLIQTTPQRNNYNYLLPSVLGEFTGSRLTDRQ